MAFLQWHRVRLLLTASLFCAPTSASSFVVPSAKRLSMVHPKVGFVRTPSLSTLLKVQGGSSADDLLERQPVPPPDGGAFAVPESSTAATDEAVATTTATTTTTTSPTSPSLLGPNAPPPGWLRRQFPTFPWHRLPNFLTYVRCLAIPALVALFYVPTIKLPNGPIYTGTLFAVASLTDWWDGYLARLWDVSTPFGAFLDPVADKLMVSTSLILLAGRYGAAVAVPALVILAREIAVSALREWMAQRGLRDVVKVGMQGKVKTALTMTALTILLLVPPPLSDATATIAGQFLFSLYRPGLAMLYLSALVTVTSGSVYFIAAAPVLFEK